MRKPIAALLILAFVAPVAGCGTAAPTGFGSKRQAQALKRQSAEGTALAVRFERAVKGTFSGTIEREGAVVTLAGRDLPMVSYDFGEAPETGKVRVVSEDFETEMTLSAILKGAGGGDFQAEALPVLLVPIATQVAIAAAKALAMYWVTHRGEEFDKGDAAKATVVAMSLALVPFVGSFGTVGQFLPLAGKLVANANSFAFKDLAKSAIGLVDEIVPLVIMLIKKRKSAEAAQA